MSIRFACESCGVRVKVPPGSAGKRVKCPACGTMQRVPEGAADDSQAGAAGVSPAAQAQGQPPAVDDAAEALAALAGALDEDEPRPAPAKPAAAPTPPPAPQQASPGGSGITPSPAAPAPPPRPQPPAAPKAIPLSSHSSSFRSTTARPMPVPIPESTGSSSSLRSSGARASSGGALPSANLPSAAPVTTGQSPAFIALVLAAWTLRILAAAMAAVSVARMFNEAPGQAMMERWEVLIHGLLVAGVAWGVAEAGAAIRSAARR